MTTEKKQPPVGVPCFVRMKRDVNGEDGDFIYVARWAPVSLWSLPGIGLRETDVVEWRECIPWDRLAIIDRYDEERREWTAHAKDGFDRADAALRECDTLRSQVTALTEERDELKTLTDELDTTSAGKWRALAVEERARADRAEKERDEAVEWKREVAEALDCIRNNGEIGYVDYVTKHARALRHFADERHDAIKERDSAIAERDEALKRNRLGLSAYETVKDCSDWVEAVATALGTYYAYDGPFVAAESTYVVDTIKKDRASREREIERLEAERDDLGCQLEALRAVQRGDVADLRTRMEAVEKYALFVDPRDAKEARDRWQAVSDYGPGVPYSTPQGMFVGSGEAVTDKKGGA